ncbi:uncharacterized protein LOC126895708 isoform X1 [Daktulosphaira vitifoliae]|uniref:uncharacterized protein LOC126895708 isoform X1 n=1 Tax=Daktulosphaira vitifoliae TaxID=58002 RepID=UPI0021AA0BCE|nr:uncharacterized protein LOC126895708 isoform X1 [Daktulosphaira vitifoliae]
MISFTKLTIIVFCVFVLKINAKVHFDDSDLSEMAHSIKWTNNLLESIDSSFRFFLLNRIMIENPNNLITKLIPKNRENIEYGEATEENITTLDNEKKLRINAEVEIRNYIKGKSKFYNIEETLVDDLKPAESRKIKYSVVVKDRCNYFQPMLEEIAAYERLQKEYIKMYGSCAIL